MLTIKIYAEENTFIREWAEVQIIMANSANYDDECEKLKADSVSVALESFELDGSDLTKDEQFEHHLQTFMPYAILHGPSQSFYLHGSDTAYIINDQGKTIEAVKAPAWFGAKVDIDTDDK